MRFLPLSPPPPSPPPLPASKVLWSVPKMLSGPTPFYVMKEFGYICITRVVLYIYIYILPRKFQAIISGSKKQQQKDSYQSEVPFSVMPGRTP